jgi:LPXTG-motif cell wall-anchored protein
MKRIFALVSACALLVAFVLVSNVPAAFAHAEPEDCTPPIDGTVTTVPTQVVCTTGQAMDPAQSSLTVWNAAGEQVDAGDSQVDLNDPDRKTISVSLDTSKITDGVYTVKYMTFSTDDNEEAEGEFTFTVDAGVSAATPEPTTAATEEPTGAATEEPTMHATAEPTAMATAEPTMEATAEPTAAATEAHEEGEAHEEEGGTHADDHSTATATVDGKEISMHIVSPAKGVAVPAGDVLLQAEVEGVTLGENDTYLNFYIGDTLVHEAKDGANSFTTTVEPGNHDVNVTLTVGGQPDVLKAHVHLTVEGAATVLPATGGEVNYALYVLIALLGAALLGTGALVFARARR